MTNAAAPVRQPAPDQSMRPPRNQWWDVWDQFKNHKGAMVGASVLLALVIFVVLGPFIWRIDPAFIEPDAVKMLKTRNLAPSLAHPLGTDQLGRDFLARMMAGGKVSLAVGLTAMLISMIVGTTVGLLAGYFKRLDNILMRLVDLFLSLPLLPLLLVMVMLFGETLRGIMGPELGTFVLIVLAIGLTSWMQCARVVRGEVLALKEREFVLAARSIGTPSRRIILRHILPNVM
ncbi:MAG: ABC transporter permease, partial [Paracoccaceae bacterium]